jgi:hypothetical protein
MFISSQLRICNVQINLTFIKKIGIFSGGLCLKNTKAVNVHFQKPPVTSTTTPGAWQSYMYLARPEIHHCVFLSILRMIYGHLDILFMNTTDSF